jgi:hypothetical protein
MVKNNQSIPNTPKTYEQFILDGQQEQNQAAVENYQTEFDAYNDISVPKGYGPYPEQYYSDNSGNYVKVTVNVDVQAERAKKAEAWESGFVEGCCFEHDLGRGLDPYRYMNSRGEGGPWDAHRFESNIGYAGEVREGRSAGRHHTRAFLRACNDPNQEIPYPVEPKNPYKD